MIVRLQHTHPHTSCRCWGQEDVENDSKKQEGDVSHNAQPEAWVLQERFIVVGEKHITNGHACNPAGNMGHERNLTKKPSMKDLYSILTKYKISWSTEFLLSMKARYTSINACSIYGLKIVSPSCQPRG